MDILIEQEIELHQYEIRQSKTDIERLIHPSLWKSVNQVRVMISTQS